MFIYNITIKVNNAILKEWMKWQMEEHIPEGMSTNLFDQYKFFRLLNQDDTEGPNFVFNIIHRQEKTMINTYRNMLLSLEVRL